MSTASFASGFLRMSCTVLLVAGTVLAADKPTSRRWAAEATADACNLTASVMDSGGKLAGRIEFGWWRPTNSYTLQIGLAQPTHARWYVETGSEGGDARRYLTGNSAYQMARFEEGEQFARDIEAGKSVEVRLQSGARFTVGASGAEAMRGFRQCIATLNAKPRPGPRWTAEAQSSRDCVLKVAGFVGAPGLEADFRVRRGSPLYFSIGARQREYPEGGVLRIEMAGPSQTWSLDSEKYSEPVPPQAESLLAALEQATPLKLTFKPHDGEVREVQAPMDGLAVGIAMFKACSEGLKSPRVTAPLPFEQVRYVINENDDACELANTFQVQGSAIWLSLVSDSKRSVLKMTRRQVRSGTEVAAIDLGKFGGPRSLTAEDGYFEIPAPEFESLRKDAVGKGREFRITTAEGKKFEAPFGGAVGVMEASMFDACVRAKRAAVARAGS